MEGMNGIGGGELVNEVLVRFQVNWTGYSTCNPQRFGQRFVNKVRTPPRRSHTSSSRASSGLTRPK